LLHREFGHGRLGDNAQPVHFGKDEVQSGQQYEMGQHAIDFLR
jgi:hypothetical protein